jgi:hypothetical protein
LLDLGRCDGGAINAYGVYVRGVPTIYPRCSTALFYGGTKGRYERKAPDGSLVEVSAAFSNAPL